mgnify:CR=1 FL=1
MDPQPSRLIGVLDVPAVTSAPDSDDDTPAEGRDDDASASRTSGRTHARPPVAVERLFAWGLLLLTTISACAFTLAAFHAVAGSLVRTDFAGFDLVPAGQVTLHWTGLERTTAFPSHVAPVEALARVLDVHAGTGWRHARPAGERAVDDRAAVANVRTACRGPGRRPARAGCRRRLGKDRGVNGRPGADRGFARTMTIRAGRDGPA